MNIDTSVASYLDIAGSQQDEREHAKDTRIKQVARELGKSRAPQMFAEAAQAARDANPPTVVSIPLAFLNGYPEATHEQLCIRVMRKRGIPVNGSHRITGLRFGFLRAERTAKELTFTWHRKDPRTAAQKAAEAGVVLEPEGA